MQNMSFSRIKMNKNVIFWVQTFFKTRHVQIFLIQNLTHFIFFNPKPYAL